MHFVAHCQVLWPWQMRSDLFTGKSIVTSLSLMADSGLSQIVAYIKAYRTCIADQPDLMHPHSMCSEDVILFTAGPHEVKVDMHSCDTVTMHCSPLAW